MKTLYERTMFEHNGILLKVAIDYEKGTVSFLQDTKPKKFVFSERGREHLGGWVKILEAMIEATKWADSNLKERGEKELDEKLDGVVFGVGDGAALKTIGDKHYWEDTSGKRYEVVFPEK